MKITLTNSTSIFLFIVLVMMLILAGPLLVIWSLNTLFATLAIPYTIWTWLAVLVLGATVAPKISSSR